MNYDFCRTVYNEPRIDDGLLVRWACEYNKELMISNSFETFFIF